MTWLITGASGQIGTRLATDLAAQAIPLRLLDHRDPDELPVNAEFVHADLRDKHAADQAVAGTSVVIHLAGVTQEGPFPQMVEHNITSTYHTLEAACRHQVPRVVLASSHHVTGLHPIGEPQPEDAPLAPDSFYAVSKVTAEALGQLYAHKSSIEVVAVRIGSYRPRPSEPRHRATWLSQPDATCLLYAAATQPMPNRFLTLYGTSNNSERWWPRTGWDALGYQPTDNASEHPSTGPLTDRWTGGTFADHGLPSDR